MGFREELQDATVRSLPLRNAIAVHAHTLIRAAVALMRHESLGCAVMVDDRRMPTGLFTEQSLIKALVQDACLDDRPVGEFADERFLAVSQDEPISRVWKASQHEGVRFVVVTDSEGKLVGITGQRGLAEYVSESFPQQVVVQRLGSTPWMQQREGA